MRRSLVLAASLLGVAAASPLAAQERRVAIPTAQNLSDMRLSPAQLKQVETMTLAENEKIDRALKANPVLRARLLTELDRISKLSEPAAQRKAIAAFQAANGAAYRGLLAQAGVNLSSLAQRLGAISPALKLEVKDGTHLVSAQSTGSSSDSSLPPGTSPLRTKRLGYADFLFESDRGCGLAAGSSASWQRTMKLEIKGFAAFIGGCQNEAFARHNFDLAANEIADVEIRAQLKIEAVAVGLGAAATTSVFAKVDTAGDDASLSCAAIAPLAWIGTCDDVATRMLRAEVNRDGAAFISVSGSVLPVAAISPATYGVSEVVIESAIIRFRQR